MSRIDPGNPFQEGVQSVQGILPPDPLKRQQMEVALQDQQAQVAERRANAQKIAQEFEDRRVDYNETQAIKQLAMAKQRAGLDLTTADIITVAPKTGAKKAQELFTAQAEQHKLQQQQLDKAQADSDAIAEAQFAARQIPYEQRVQQVPKLIQNLTQLGHVDPRLASAMLDPSHWTDEELDADILSNTKAHNAQIAQAKQKVDDDYKKAETEAKNAEAAKNRAEAGKISGEVTNYPQSPDEAKQIIGSIFGGTKDPRYVNYAGQIDAMRFNPKTADDLVKEARKEAGSTRTAVATAKATEPIRIETAAGTAAAQANAGGQGGLDLMAEQALNGNFTSRNAVLLGKVYARAAQIAKERGMTSTQVVLEQNAAKANREALGKLTTQSAQVEAFSATAQKNMKMLQGAVDAIGGTSPLLNQPMRTISLRVSGDPKVSAFYASLLPAQTEIAKILNSANATGVLTNEAREDMQKAIGQDATPAQIRAALDIFSKEMQNRKESYAATIEDLKQHTAVGNQNAPSGNINSRGLIVPGGAIEKLIQGQKK